MESRSVFWWHLLEWTTYFRFDNLNVNKLLCVSKYMNANDSFFVVVDFKLYYSDMNFCQNALQNFLVK
jgi:hypothetical protein